MADFYFSGPMPRTPDQIEAAGDLGPIDEDLPRSPEQLEQVTAVPATPEDTEPTDEIPEASVMEEEPLEDETEALQTTVAKPSMEPGQTEAVKSAEDDTEQMFKDYETARKSFVTESEELGKEGEEFTKKQKMMTGIAGALQSFGEGLAAITGGSAKPLQTAAQTVQRMGEIEAAGREGKAKTLKERLMLARQPLEAKAEEIKFRDVFERRQKAKRLEDPTSDESQQARQLANNFLDAYVSSVANRANDTQLAKLESIRPRLENLNANQIKDFMDNLNKLKFTESKTEIEEAKEERTTKQQTAKTTASQEFKVQQDAQKAIVKVENEFDQDQKFYDQYKQFRSNLQKAIAGDPDAQRFIKNNMAAFSYLKARTLESKGVFTDQDAERLTTLLKDQTWAEKFQTWIAGGLQGEIPIDTLQKLSDALKDDPKNPSALRNEKLKRYSNVAKNSTNPAIQNSARYYESLIQKEPETAESQQPQSFKSADDASEAKKKGLINSGEIIIINGKRWKVK